MTVLPILPCDDCGVGRTGAGAQAAWHLAFPEELEADLETRSLVVAEINRLLDAPTYRVEDTDSFVRYDRPTKRVRYCAPGPPGRAGGATGKRGKENGWGERH